MPRFAVIDVETTGLSTTHNHRVVEVAIVLVDGTGNTVYEWDTLLNPQRDVGATDIHGLGAADLFNAPTFDEVAADIRGALAGNVPVAHNLFFDARFLAAEFERIGVQTPLNGTTGLCTMRLAQHYLPIKKRTLETCCDYIEYSPSGAHAALADALAAAKLLAYYLNMDQHDFHRKWGAAIRGAAAQHWPAVPRGSGRRLSRRQAKTTQPEHFLARIAARAPRTVIGPISPPDVEPYVELVDRVLLNRCLSRHEADELVATANMVGLAREEAIEVHRQYLKALCRQAWADGVITGEEQADLELVTAVLGLDPGDLDAALADARLSAGADQQLGTLKAKSETFAFKVGTFVLGHGDAVVFTGETPAVSRARLESLTRGVGLRVTGAVSRKTRLLVAADPDSLSGKARRARELGIPIVDVDAYLRMLDSLG